MMISLIAAIDENNGLGYENKLLCHLPADLKHFKEITTNKPIIMGRRTFDSIGRPLPNRKNIVISNQCTQIEGVTVVSNIKDAIQSAGQAPEIMIIGGARIFDETIDMAQRLYITMIHHQFKADVYFPDIKSDHWKITKQVAQPADEKNPHAMSFYQFDKL